MVTDAAKVANDQEKFRNWRTLRLFKWMARNRYAKRNGCVRPRDRGFWKPLFPGIGSLISFRLTFRALLRSLFVETLSLTN